MNVTFSFDYLMMKQYFLAIFTASSSGYDNGVPKKAGFQTTTTTSTPTANGQAKSVLQMSNDWRNQAYHQEQNMNSNNYSR